MSTPERLHGVKAERPAERALFQALLDDAAVFPPQSAPLPQAVADHVARQSTSYADLVGPLLLPASLVEDFYHAQRSQHPDVALVDRPDMDLATIRRYADALATLGEAAGDVVGFEILWSPGWHRSLSLGVPVSVEVPRGAGLQDALADLRSQAGDGHAVRAKLRTGATSEQPAATSAELAGFIRACVDHDLSFKLTGGLHHAISATTPTGQAQLGFLNVIAATRWALAHGAEVPEMDSLLSQRDPVPTLDIITRMSRADASVLRAFFTSYGCCRVMDPIGDLAALGLIEQTSRRRTG
jgi:hypothetical protein